MRRRLAATPAVAGALAAALWLAAAVSAGGDGAAAGSESAAVLRVESRPVAAAPACTGAFVAHPLDHTTEVDERPVGFYASNGSGLAAGDLDGDGDLDLVLGNLDGRNAIFWNRGALRFRKEELPVGNTRSVVAVDADGDGRLDLSFTHRLLPPTLWRNLGGAAPRFAEVPGFGGRAIPYAVSWGDLDQDGDLDMAAASYDTEIPVPSTEPPPQREDYMGPSDPVRDAGGAVARWLSAIPAASGTPGGGVFVYLQERPGEFRIVRLARESQALALGLPDLDGDGRLDIHVGNDFALPDAVFLAAGGRWERAEPLAAMTRNTMSLDAGDVDNDGVDELFATDMKPYRPTRKEADRWYFVVVGMEELPPEDPQVVRNVLLRREGDGYRDVAVAAGVDASGWSWSSRLGDLDQDGFLDIYVVNGMVSAELFGQLPGAELTERNLAFRNRGDGTFSEAAEWALDDTAGGRGMTMADLDDDGDLDIAVNNLLSPAVVFENRLCGGASLQVALRRPGSGNHYALGARVTVVTSAGNSVRQMRSTAGYLSGEPPRLHFGLPAGARIESLTIVWPDGRTSHVRGDPRLAPGRIVTIERS